MIKEFTMFDIDFVVKNGTMGKRVYTKYLDITVNSYGTKTLKSAYEQGIAILEEKGEAETKKSYKYYINKRIRSRFFNDVRIQKLFNDIFKLNLQDLKDRFSGILGDCIDVVKFDKIIKTPDGVSTADFVRKIYGQKAKKLMEKLI